MVIITERSAAEAVKSALLNNEQTKAKVIKALTQPEFLEVEQLINDPESLKEKLKLIAESLDLMYEPIQKQKLKIANAQIHLSEANKKITEKINTNLTSQLKQIPKIKGFIVSKDIEKINKRLQFLNARIAQCLGFIEEIKLRE